jgi:hypothetical protein
VTFAEVLPPARPPITKGGDACERDLRLDTATAPSDVNGPDRQDATVSDLSHVVLVKLEYLEVPIVGKELPYSLVPHERPLDGTPRRNDHDILGGVADDVIDIAVVYGAGDSAHDVHVLQRHRLRPFLAEAFRRSTGLVDVQAGDHVHKAAVLPGHGPRSTLLDATGSEQTTAFATHDESDSAA